MSGGASWPRARLGLALACSLAVLACKGRPAAPILTWHAIGPPGAAAADDADGWTVSQDRFEAQLDALAAAGFTTVPLALLAGHAATGAPLPARPVVLTFDDGTQDHYARALPALVARGMRGSFFVVSGRVGTRAQGGRAYLSWDELKALRGAGMEVGSHSRSHPRLPDLPDEAARAELVESRRELEAGLGAPVEWFAFPYNALRERHRAMVAAAGYRGAVAGVAHGGSDLRSLYRLPVRQETAPAALVAALGGR